MPRSRIAAAAMLLWAGAAFAAPASPLLVVQFDQQYAQGTFARNGQWLGLFCDNALCELKRAAVRIKNGKATNVLDEVEELDVLDVDGDPLAQFYGTTLAAGKVTTWYRPGADPTTSGAVSHLRALGRWAMPWGAAPLTLSWVKLPELHGYRYHLTDGVNKQFLFSTALEGHYGGATTPVIYWVGDLDQDGKIDLLLGLPDDNCGFDQRLYLSSLAATGALVAKAAALVGSQAACGC
jgi:hypothetical protein